jgi:hypothetical protein
MPQLMFLIFLKGGGLNFHQVPIVLIKFSNSSHQNAFVPIKFFLFSSSSHCFHQLSISFLLFPTWPYTNPHKAVNFDIKSFFCNLYHCIYPSSFFGSHNMACCTCCWIMVHFKYVFFITHHGCFWRLFLPRFFFSAYSYMFEDDQDVTYTLVMEGT